MEWSDVGVDIQDARHGDTGPFRLQSSGFQILQHIVPDKQEDLRTQESRAQYTEGVHGPIDAIVDAELIIPIESRGHTH